MIMLIKLADDAGDAGEGSDDADYSDGSSVADPDPYGFGPPGSGSVSQRSGSLYHQAKIVRKTRFLLFCDFFFTL